MGVAYRSFPATLVELQDALRIEIKNDHVRTYSRLTDEIINAVRSREDQLVVALFAAVQSANICPCLCASFAGAQGTVAASGVSSAVVHRGILRLWQPSTRQEELARYSPEIEAPSELAPDHLHAECR